jgi:ABC-type nitrate/sulfonate/bicarbonate transport system substrate-binding protein
MPIRPLHLPTPGRALQRRDFLRLSALVGGGSALWALAGCSGDEAPATATSAAATAAASSEVVYFKYPEWTYYDLVYLAEELGLFDDATVKPQNVGKVAAGDMIPFLTTGDLDLANRHTPLVLAAVAAGADCKIIAAGSKSTKENPHMKYFVRADSPIKGLEDFAGSTLGINSMGACSEFVTKKALQEAGIDPDAVEWITAPDSEQEEPLLRGDTDIAIIHPLSSGRASANTADFRLLFSDWDLDGGISGMCPYSVSGTFLREHPDKVTELIGILSEAARWNNANREEARKIIADRFGFKLEEAEMFEFYEDQIIPDENIDYWYERLIAEGRIEEGQVPREDLYTNDYNPAN